MTRHIKVPILGNFCQCYVNYRRSQIDKRRLCIRRDTRQTVGTLGQVLKAVRTLYRCSESAGADSKIQVLLRSLLSSVSLIVAGLLSRHHRGSGLNRQYIVDSGPREG